MVLYTLVVVSLVVAWAGGDVGFTLWGGALAVDDVGVCVFVLVVAYPSAAEGGDLVAV